jgi:hypothetical protein
MQPAASGCRIVPEVGPGTTRHALASFSPAHAPAASVCSFSTAACTTCCLWLWADAALTNCHAWRPSLVDARLQARDDLDAALRRLRDVRCPYWDEKWRRDSPRHERYPGHEIRDVVEACLELLDANRSRRPWPGREPLVSR